eukprot:Phypoly_transcript_08025.p1 GENE.Phypoly_transcript_08025~~Phypoly_transcript_08025.p1  ORF type:complete len:225 (+),score=47.30 Phypoly_transcript_08025:798-1472(+)
MEVVPKKDVMAFSAFFHDNTTFRLIDVCVEVKHAKNQKEEFEHKYRESTIGEFVREALSVCKKLNNDKLPENIMIFREGFSKIHLDKMQQTEVRVIQQAVGNMHGYEPKYVAALIGRSEEIFFTDDFRNPEPGTLIADDVTSLAAARNNSIDEFYLISHATKFETAIMGTRYVVLQNQAMTNEALRALMFKYCHLSFSKARTSKTPAPSNFVHKIAFQAANVVN